MWRSWTACVPSANVCAASLCQVDESMRIPGGGGGLQIAAGEFIELLALPLENAPVRWHLPLLCADSSGKLMACSDLSVEIDVVSRVDRHWPQCMTIAADVCMMCA